MIEQTEIKDEGPLNREFCECLANRLCEAFKTSADKDVYSLWCDGVIGPFMKNQLTKKSVNDTRKIKGATAFIGTEGHWSFELTINFGKYSLRRFAKGASLIDCIPSSESMDWITLEIENKKIEMWLQ